MATTPSSDTLGALMVDLGQAEQQLKPEDIRRIRGFVAGTLQSKQSTTTDDVQASVTSAETSIYGEKKSLMVTLKGRFMVSKDDKVINLSTLRDLNESNKQLSTVTTTTPAPSTSLVDATTLVAPTTTVVASTASIAPTNANTSNMPTFVMLRYEYQKSDGSGPAPTYIPLYVGHLGPKAPLLLDVLNSKKPIPPWSDKSGYLFCAYETRYYNTTPRGHLYYVMMQLENVFLIRAALNVDTSKAALVKLSTLWERDSQQVWDVMRIYFQPPSYDSQTYFTLHTRELLEVIRLWVGGHSNVQARFRITRALQVQAKRKLAEYPADEPPRKCITR